MSNRVFTKDLYEAIVAAYREKPANYSHAARTAHIGMATAKKAWESGWVRTHSWAIPISVVLQNEKEEAKLLAAKIERDKEKEREKDRELARKRSIEAKADEEQTIRAGRKDVLGLLIIATELHAPMRTLAQRVGKLLNDPATVIDLKEGMACLNRYALYSARAVDAADTITKLSRLDAGEATEITKQYVEYATPADAVREIEEANAAMQRMRERGLLPEEDASEAAAPAEGSSELH